MDSASRFRTLGQVFGAVVLGIFLLIVLPIIGLVTWKLWRVPAWVLNADPASQSARNAVVAYRSASGEVLQGLVPIAGGIFLALGAWIAVQELRARREEHHAERLDRALALAASDRPEMRVAGVAAIEGLAMAFPIQRQTLVGVLAGFVRERSRERTATRKSVPADIDAALWAISRLNSTSKIPYTVDLTESALSHAVLPRIDLRNAVLSGANLAGAVLTEARLDGVICTRANLSNADCSSASMRSLRGDAIDAQGCKFVRAYLGWGSVTFGDFRKADFSGARIENMLMSCSDMRGTSFENAEIVATVFYYTDARGADLRFAPPHHAPLSGPGLVIDDTTKLPAGVQGLGRAPLHDQYGPAAYRDQTA